MFEEKEHNVKESIDDERKSNLYTEGKITKKFGDFTDDAIICRSILYYWVKTENVEFFRSRFLIENWLLENCQYFKDRYSGQLNKTNVQNKINQNNSYVSLLLERLNYLSLLESRSVIAKNYEETTEYRFTTLGKLVASILKFNENPNNDYSFLKKIYKQTLNYYRTQHYSFAKFYILFFINCYKKHKGVFEHVIISNLLYIIKEPPNDKNSVLNKLRNFPIFYDSESLYVILINSLNNFKSRFPEDYQKVIYKLKFCF